MKLGTEKPGITTSWLPVWYIFVPMRENPQVMGDVVLRGKLPHAM
jgi:hypothetical protein